MKIRFISDFARNWKAGDIVEAKTLPNGDTLVDNVACIDTTLLMEHCEVVTESGDNVNHPNHYNIPGRKECIVEMEEKFGKEAVITFCTLNAYKYKYRHELKGGKEDLEKAKWYDNYAKNIYLENGDEFEGYSSYSLDVISDYLKRYFSFAQPEQIKKESPLINIKPKEIPTIKHTYKYRTAKLNNQTHLCDSCKYTYLDCPSKSKDVIIKNSEGNDNICACNKYKPSSQLSDEYEQGWKDGRKALQEEIWGRNRLRLEVNKIGKFVPEFNFDDDEPERQKGEWIRNDNGTYSCSLCQSWIPKEQRHYARYCLYCGADMRGEQK